MTDDGTIDSGRKMATIEHNTPDQYALDEVESQRIFSERIVPDQLNGTKQDRPVAVFIGGQPGDGKASITALTRGLLDRRGRAVTLASSAYEPYHPDFHALIASNSLDAAEGVTFDGRRWLVHAESLVIAERYDAVIETDLYDPAELAASARRFKSAGYRVEVALIAVHASLSRIGGLKRHMLALQAFGLAQMATASSHDRCYEGVLKAAALVDETEFADVVAVLRPNGHRVHSNQRMDDGRWQQSPGTSDAIRRERERPWTALESKQFLADVWAYEHYGIAAPDQSIRDAVVRETRQVIDLARPRLHPTAATAHIATTGTADQGS
ncbi:zeta toxin family protein [Kribbella kalugense]|uniref:UDP-N-acetylglucosamine kinase n=1 Tax=Kribbella kalugense TaxID=2512221 RepID=A0A4V3G8U6_9ACTN|nr:zeta toxin family protein [Kribbella kalugense]TDW24284.1 zeta toxin [Kribbella kalugense]